VEKKQRTQATRQRTKRRRLQLAEEAGGKETATETLPRWEVEPEDAIASRQEAAGGAVSNSSDEDEPSFIPSEAFEKSRPGYAFKVGPCGLGYYRIDRGEEDEPGTLPNEGIPSARADEETVEVWPSPEECLQRAVDCYQRIRATDGRQKRAVVVLVDGDKHLSKLPPKFGAAQVKKKAKSKKGVGSETKSKFEFQGIGCIASVKDDRLVSETLAQYRSGKLSTLFVTDDCVPLLAPLAGRTSVLLQVTRFPSLATFRARRDILAGQYGQQGGAAGIAGSKRAACFFSVPPSAAASIHADAEMLVSRLWREGREVSRSLADLASSSTGR